MKRVIAITLLTALCLNVFACGQEDVRTVLHLKN